MKRDMFDVELEVAVTILDLTCQEKEITLRVLYTPFEEYSGDRVVGVYLYPMAVWQGRGWNRRINAIEEDLIIAEANINHSYGDCYRRSCAC